MRGDMTRAQGLVGQGGEVLPTKVCPQCGQVLFEDMDVCYGCLHDFSREVDVSSLGLPVTLLEHVEPASGGVPVAEGDSLPTGTPEELPAHSGVVPTSLALRVRSSDVELTVPLPPTGVMVGRLSTNDVVLRARSVSRHHVLIAPDGRGARVVDQGATNPALLDGVEVTSSVDMGLGSVLDVCGVTFTLVRAEDGGAVVS